MVLPLSRLSDGTLHILHCRHRSCSPSPNRNRAPGQVLCSRRPSFTASRPGFPTQGGRVPAETAVPASPPIRPTTGLPASPALGARFLPGLTLTSADPSLGSPVEEVRHPPPQQPPSRQPLPFSFQRQLFRPPGPALRAPPSRSRACAILTPPKTRIPRGKERHEQGSPTGSRGVGPSVAGPGVPEVVLVVDGAVSSLVPGGYASGLESLPRPVPYPCFALRLPRCLQSLQRRVTSC